MLELEEGGFIQGVSRYSGKWSKDERHRDLMEENGEFPYWEK